MTGALTAGTLSGNGAGLTNLNASNLASGTIPDARQSANIPLLNAANTFSASTNTFSNDLVVGGNLHTPGKPWFVAGDSAGWHSAAAGWTHVIYNTVTGGNAGGWYSTATGNFTAPVSGVYLCSSTHYCDGSCTGYIHHLIACNGAWDSGCGVGVPYSYTLFREGTVGGESTTSTRWVMLNAGDYVQTNIYHSDGSNYMYGAYSQFGCVLLSQN